MPFNLPPEQDATDERIVGYVGRLVSFMTNEQLDLAVVATEDAGVLARLAEKSKQGKAVLGLTSEQIRDSRLGTAVDPKADALIHFALQVVKNRVRFMVNLDAATKEKISLSSELLKVAMSVTGSAGTEAHP